MEGAKAAITATLITTAGGTDRRTRYGRRRRAGCVGELRVLGVPPAHHTPRYSPASSSAGAVPWTSLRARQESHSG